MHIIRKKNIWLAHDSQEETIWQFIFKGANVVKKGLINNGLGQIAMQRLRNWQPQARRTPSTSSIFATGLAFEVDIAASKRKNA